ncbi:MAG: hypothetical protein D6703_06335 [Zetaproteobacteria bacterium]|nr:MAG: hypothetical protein D6703_06335 [Zetaproteobacteria bacterium]
MKKVSFWLLILLMGGFLACCSSNELTWKPPAQQWQDLTIEVESRPELPRQGMNEFIVIVNRARRGYISDLIVNVRTEHSGAWRQAMPDGALGVYRRALPVEDPEQEHLYVQLIRGKKGQAELVFPLAAGSRSLQGRVVEHH